MTGRGRRWRIPATWCSATPSRTSNIVLRTLGDTGTRFEFECYDTSHLYNLANFLERGLVRTAVVRPDACSEFWAASVRIRKTCCT